jgi:hypothetical protein
VLFRKTAQNWARTRAQYLGQFRDEMEYHFRRRSPQFWQTSLHLFLKVYSEFREGQHILLQRVERSDGRAIFQLANYYRPSEKDFDSGTQKTLEIGVLA